MATVKILIILLFEINKSELTPATSAFTYMSTFTKISYKYKLLLVIVPKVSNPEIDTYGDKSE